jgi:hypothetical protein
MKGRERNALARRSDAHELSAMRAVPCHPRSNPVAFGDDIFDCAAHIREGRPRRGHPLLEAVTAGRLVRNGVVIDEVGRDEFVEAIGVASANRIDDASVRVLELLFGAYDCSFASPRTCSVPLYQTAA